MKKILNAQDINRFLTRLAHEIIENNKSGPSFVRGKYKRYKGDNAYNKVMTEALSLFINLLK